MHMYSEPLVLPLPPSHDIMYAYYTMPYAHAQMQHAMLEKEVYPRACVSLMGRQAEAVAVDIELRSPSLLVNFCCTSRSLPAATPIPTRWWTVIRELNRGIVSYVTQRRWRRQ